MNETARRLMDLAAGHMRHTRYGGFSFRELAAEIGIKSASLHHHCPTKATMAAAVARRYADRSLQRSRIGGPDAEARAHEHRRLPGLVSMPQAERAACCAAAMI